MTKPMLGALACLLLCADLAVAQVSLGFRETPASEPRAQHSAVAPTQLPEGSPPPADFAPPALDLGRTGGLELQAAYPAGPDWVSASTSYYWLRAEYLLWQVKPGPLPVPLVTTGPADVLGAGILGAPGTAVVLGESNLQYRAFSGIRASFGLWLDNDQTAAVEAVGFLLPTQVARFAVASSPNGEPFLAIPVKNAITDKEEASPIAVPGTFSGSAALNSTSSLWGAEINILRSGFRDSGLRANWLAGLRYLGLQESIAFFQNSAPLAGNTLKFNNTDVNPPSSVTVYDRFNACNQFYGGQLGAQLEYCRGRLFVNAVGKLALGASHQVINVSGNSSLNTPGQPPVVIPGGFLAVGSNIGSGTLDRFAVVPEAGLRVGYQLTSRLSISVGYNILYWSSVARPGSQIDRTVNPTLVPTTLVFGQAVDGPQRPTLNVHQTDFWAQGVTFGLEWQF